MPPDLERHHHPTNQPEWWPHTSCDWTHLWRALKKLQPDQLEQLTAQENWNRIDRGETNFNYCLSFSEQKYFVQVLSQEQRKKRPSPQFNDIHRVLNGLTSINAWLVACRFESDRLRVFDWITSHKSVNKGGDWLLSRKDFFAFLGALHSRQKKLPVLQITHHIDHYYQLALARNTRVKSYLFSLREKAHLLAQNFHADSVCHNDLSPDNILLAPELKIIDWEYACVSDPAFELAVICENFNLNQSQQRGLILNYSQNSAFQLDCEKLNEMKQLYRILAEFWRL